MAIPAYLWITDDAGREISGAVDVKDREKSIEVTCFDHSITVPTDNHSGRVTANHQHHAYCFEKEIDCSSPYLYKALTTGQTLKCAEFILYKINNTGQEQPYFVTRLENVKIVGIIPLMADVKDFRNEQYTHFEYIEMVYQKISWLYIDGNIKHTDSWNERKTA